MLQRTVRIIAFGEQVVDRQNANVEVVDADRNDRNRVRLSVRSVSGLSRFDLQLRVDGVEVLDCGSDKASVASVRILFGCRILDKMLE